MAKRDYISLKEKLAAALSRLLPSEHERELREKQISAKEILQLFHFDHIVLHSLGGADLWYNLDPKRVEEHREKSKKDTSIAAKVKRINKEPERWVNLTGPKAPARDKVRKYRWPKKKLQSRNNLRRK